MKSPYRSSHPRPTTGPRIKPYGQERVLCALGDPLSALNGGLGLGLESTSGRGMKRLQRSSHPRPTTGPRVKPQGQGRALGDPLGSLSAKCGRSGLLLLLICSAHAQKWLFMHFRCKFRHRRSIRRPGFPIRVHNFGDLATFYVDFCI